MRVGGHAVDVAVAVVLAAHVVRRVGVRHGAEQRVQRVLQRLGVTARRRLDRHAREDLHEVVDHHVAQRADGVVEVAAVGDAEALGHRDLHRRDVVAVPYRFEQGVREAQEQRLGEPHLPEEVVDPVQLGLVEVLVDLVVERPRRGQVVAEGLLHDDARALDEPRRGQALHDGSEEERRDLQVEDGCPRVAEDACEALERLGVGEVAGDVREARRETREDLVVHGLACGLDRRAGVRAQLVDRPVVDCHADDGAGQQAAALEAIQRPERHHLGEVSCDPEGDEDVRGALPGGASPRREHPL